MERKRLAFLLVSLILLDYCHGVPELPSQLRLRLRRDASEDPNSSSYKEDAENEEEASEESQSYEEDDGEGDSIEEDSLEKLDRLRGTEVGPVREKRGVGALIFYGVTLTAKLTSLGLALGAAISKGCSYYPSICKNRDAIERLDQSIKAKIAAYEREYMANKKQFIYIRDSNLNNRYFQYYLNETIKAVTSAEEIEENIIQDFEYNFPLLQKMYSLAANGSDFQTFLDSVLGQLEYSLGDINNLLEENKKSQLIGLAVQMLVEITLNRFMGVVQSAYQEVRALEDVDIMRTTFWDYMMEGKTPPPAASAAQKNLGQRLKAWKNSLPKKFGRAWKTVKVIISKPKRFLVSAGNSIKKWKRIKSWKGFKGKLKHSLRGPISKINAAKNFIRNPKQTLKYTSKNFKLGWSTKIMLTLGLIGDAVTTALSVNQWAQVAQQMEDARKQYEEYERKLINSTKQLEIEKDAMSDVFDNIIDGFKEIVTNFTELVTAAKGNSDFAGVSGEAGLPVNLKDPLFTMDFDTITKTNLLAKQQVALDYIRSVDGDLGKILDKLRARRTLYTTANQAVNETETIQDTTSDLKRIYSVDISEIVKAYGERLGEKDVICAVSILHMYLNHYDYFDLSVWRPNCTVTAKQFQHQQEEARKLRMKAIMDDILEANVPGQEESVTGLLETVKIAYSHYPDAEIKAFGEKLTLKDVLCAIRRLFPEITQYAFYPMASFNPPCNDLTDAQFARIQQQADDAKEIYDNIGADLDYCDRRGRVRYCDCIADFVDMYGIAEDLVKSYIKKHRPNKSQYCSRCGCVNV